MRNDTIYFVIGHFADNYIGKAKKIGASYFDMGEKWDSFTSSVREAANDHFIDVIANKGDQVYSATQKNFIKSPSSLGKEVSRLTDEKGYKWVNQWSLKKR